MRFDTLLFSRTLREDYRWMHRPHYVDDSINTLLRPLFLLIESTRNREFFIERGMRNFYFFVEKEYCVLCYLYFTNRMDVVGRQIYAVEGICCSKEDCELMWHLLPEIIFSAYQMGIGFHMYISDEEQSEKLFPKTLEIAESKKYVWKEGMYDASILNLVDEMRCAQTMYSFVFGTEDDSFYKTKFDKFYKVRDKRRQATESPSVLAEFIEAEVCDIKFYFAKEDQRYTLSIIAFDQSGNMISGYTDAVSFDKYGISLAELNFIMEEVESDMTGYGYVVNQEQYGKRNKTRRLKIVSEADYMSSCDLPVHRVKCRLRVSDGQIADFVKEEEKIIRQLFLHSRRIKGLYYGVSRGIETVYILNMESGLWMFYVEWAGKGNGYYLEGIVVENSRKRDAWLHRGKLIKKYLWRDTKYSEAFEDAYEKFLAESGKNLQPRSSIITSLPEGNFPKLGNVDVYSVLGEKRLFTSIDNKEEIIFPESFEDDEQGERYSLIPPALGFGKWHLISTEAYVKGKLRSKVRLNSIVNGSCKAKLLFKEVDEAVEKLQN